MGSSADQLSPATGSKSAVRGVSSRGSLTLEDIVSRVRTVPVAPQVLPKLQAALNDPDTEVADVSQLIKLDAGLASSMLKLANTAHYARGGSIVSLEAAIGRIGFQETFRLVVRCSYASVLRGELSCYGKTGDGMWREAVLAAFAMDQLCEYAGVERSAGYVAGLLHAVGMSANEDYLKRQELRAPRFEGVTRAELVEWERNTIGFTHAEVGGAMLRRWQVPTGIAVAVERQLDTSISADDPMLAVLLPVALHLAEHVSGLSDGSENPEEVSVADYDQARLDRAGLDADKLAQATAAVCEVWSAAGDALM